MGGEEWADLVDEDDRVVGRAPRSRIRRENLLHRGVAIVVRNPAGDVYVHRRTDHKDVFPGLWDIGLGGMVTAGETYDACALREAGEELGVAGVALTPAFRHRYSGPHNNAHIAVYEVTWDGPVRPQPEEIAEGGWRPLHGLREWLGQRPVVPDGLEIFDRWLAAHPTTR